MANERVIIWGKEEACFNNDELSLAGTWAEKHVKKCPEMGHWGIAYSILTRESEGGGYVGFTKVVECRSCHTKFILSQYFIDTKTGRYVKEEENENNS